MKLEKFIISYQFGSNLFKYNDELYNHLQLRLKNQNICNIYINEEGLNIKIDFFLVENIYFWLDENINTYFFSNRRQDYWQKSENSSKIFFKKNGFYYLSTTPFDGIRVLLSFLKYTFGKKVVVNSLLENITQSRSNFDEIVNSFQTEIYVFRQSVKNKYLLPISGGMDSRLIFEYFIDDPNLLLYTHGENECGDVRIVKDILTKYPVNNHKFIDISVNGMVDLTINSSKCDYFLPPERLMYPLFENVYPGEDFVVLSGLYGEHVFSDQNKKINFLDFIQDKLIDYNLDEIDLQIVQCYSEKLISEKLAFILLRCQKLTKQSLNMTDLDCFIPFLKNSVLSSVENYSINGLYSDLVKRMMRKKLRSVLHQTSLSHFTYPKWYRFFEKVYYKFLNTKYKKPYYSNELTSKFIEKNNLSRK